MTTEETLTKQITGVVGSAGSASEYEFLVSDLVLDVLHFSFWYGVDDPDEIQVDYGTSLSALVDNDVKRQLLAKTIRRYVLDNSSNDVNADEVTRLSMERIVNWQSWYPEWYEDNNFKAYLFEAGEDEAVYDSDYSGDNGIGDYF